MSGDIHEILSKVTAGSVPGWMQLVMLGIIAWRGVPGFLSAVAKGFELVANRQSQVEERLSRLLDEQATRFSRDMEAQAKRFEAENESLRRQHKDCIETSDKQGARIDKLEEEITTLRDEKSSLLAAFRQQQASTVAVLPGSIVSRNIQDAAARVKE